MGIGEKIEMLCNKMGVQKQELAESVGIGKQHLSGVISGKKAPSRTLLKRIADYFNVDLRFFDDDASAADIRETAIMEHLPDDLQEWINSKNSRPYLVLAKMINDKKLDANELSAIIEIIQADKDGQ